ncbi:MAG: hypothetical protein A2406_03835 [Candidatus Komeilibacteria bacterium RIFOXYC1_FULL_37_11]|uniref:Ligand-binding protein SH3 n=1 Tax=Candidatus Komeilibacteria bacterium RIFOXYC1_FULL_37_11 TaxID=1798555 RepID=A0A1G2BWX0_9BACT|nr:MAG: hypothetical protein A2406_03835 [Candidatus Komeilibacteria bacterium RIFOXYC1_FULL_37_11]OGY95884.1 MAG: hypothetical protein A2611_03885 [Candidatus Komeilibacteria bacterium RIFOXYD1_FULL_37_29]
MDISWIYNIDPLLATFLVALIPVLELRASIPIALANFDLTITQIFTASVLGSFLPAIVIVYWLEPISNVLRKIKFFDRFFEWLFKRTRAKFDKKYALGSNVALMFFVGVPLPGTGAWTGALIAWLFNFDKKQALVAIFLGCVIAALIVLLASLGVIKIFDFIL